MAWRTFCRRVSTSSRFFHVDASATRSGHIRHRGGGRGHRIDFRFHERLPRHGERHGHLRRDRSAPGALRPRVAVAVAGVLNLAGAFLSVQVAKTISGGLVDEVRITPAVIFAGLVGAILWNLLTWLLGLP